MPICTAGYSRALLAVTEAAFAGYPPEGSHAPLARTEEDYRDQRTEQRTGPKGVITSGPKGVLVRSASPPPTNDADARACAAAASEPTEPTEAAEVAEAAEPEGALSSALSLVGVINGSPPGSQRTSQRSSPLSSLPSSLPSSPLSASPVASRPPRPVDAQAGRQAGGTLMSAAEGRQHGAYTVGRDGLLYPTDGTRPPRPSTAPAARAARGGARDFRYV